MVNRQFGGVLPFLRRLIGTRVASELTDGELLARFVERQDEAAFETLLRRHGPTVLGVCRRLLFDPQEVEDAFQATFLVLIRRAGDLGRRELVGNWLYGVAYRTAVRARAQAMRRHQRHTPMDDVAGREEPCPLHREEMGSLIDQEVHRLPDKYRVPFVLCAIEGRTNEQAAEELGLPKGTIATRLARARARLRARLERRGVALTALLTLLLGDSLRAAVPHPLAAATTASALAAATGKTLTVIAAVPAALAGAVLRELFLVKVRAVATAVIALGVALSGGVVGLSNLPQLIPAAATRAEVTPRDSDSTPPSESRSQPRSPGTLLRRERACLDPIPPIPAVLLETPLETRLLAPTGDAIRIYRIRVLGGYPQASFVDRATTVWFTLAASDGTIAPLPSAMARRYRLEQEGWIGDEIVCEP